MSARLPARRAAPLALALSTAWALGACGTTGGGSAERSAGGSAAAQAVVTRARTLVAAAPEALGYRLVVAGPRAGLRGQADRDAHTITLFVAPTDAPHRVAHDLAHELGHAYDDQRMTDAERVAYLRRRGAARAQWWPGGDTSDYTSGAGDFAEVFALCHAASPVYRSRLAQRPDDPCSLLPAGARMAPSSDPGRSSS